MKILITGGNGFIARSLFEKLHTQYSVLSVNRQNLDLLDTNDVRKYLKKNYFDVIIHTATYDAAPVFSTKDPTKVLENNLKMFFNIVRNKRFFKKMIYFGSGAEFDRNHWIPKMKENYFDTYVPQDQYGFSKYIMTKYTLLNDNIYNLRLFGVFGKHDDWRYRFIPNICCRAVLNKSIVIKQNKIFDYIYIDDLIKIVEWFINNTPAEKVYNVCTGKSYEFKTLAEKLIKISGKKLNIIIKEPKCSQEYSGDNLKLMKELKNFKFTPIETAIRNLYNWYKNNKHIINENELFLF